MNKATIGVVIIMLFQLLGMVVERQVLPMVPASIIGMVALFIALQIKLIKEEWIVGVVDFLMGNMALFFLPPSVGIIVALPLVKGDILPISLAIIVSTVAVIASVGLTHQWLSRDKTKSKK